LAARLKDALGVEAELIKSGGGVFEVTVDGDLVFSKKRTGRFPTEDEVLELIESR
jgi:selenoprotein W-related protein